MSMSKKKRKRAHAGMNGGKAAPNLNNKDPLKKALAGSTSITLDVVSYRHWNEFQFYQLSHFKPIRQPFVALCSPYLLTILVMYG